MHLSHSKIDKHSNLHSNYSSKKPTPFSSKSHLLSPCENVQNPPWKNPFLLHLDLFCSWCIVCLSLIWIVYAWINCNDILPTQAFRKRFHVRITSSIRCQCYFQSITMLLLLIIHYCRYGLPCQTIHVGSDISFIYQEWKDSSNSYKSLHEWSSSSVHKDWDNGIDYVHLTRLKNLLMSLNKYFDSFVFDLKVGGWLRCIGSPQHLKTWFGNHLEPEVCMMTYKHLELFREIKFLFPVLR